MNKNSLVTGGAGFIGSHLTEALLARGHRVTVVDNLACGRKENLPIHENLIFMEVDICDRNALEPCFEGVDWVFHLAGLADIVPSIENPDKYFKTNVIGTFNVMQASKKANIKKLIYGASASCYGFPDKFPTTEKSKISPMYPYAFTPFPKFKK